MYKDQLQGEKEEKENTEYTMLNEIKENEVPKVPESQEHQQVPQASANVRRYTWLSRAPERFSPSLYYLLMTDYGEPKCYEEGMHVSRPGLDPVTLDVYDVYIVMIMVWS